MKREYWYLAAETAGFSTEAFTTMRRGGVVTLRNLEMDWTVRKSWTRYINSEQRAEIQNFLAAAEDALELKTVDSRAPGALMPPPLDAYYHLRWLPRLNRRAPVDALTLSGAPQETVDRLKARGKLYIGDLCRTAEVIVQEWLWDDYAILRDAALMFLQPTPSLAAQLIDAVDRRTADPEELYTACKPCLQLLAPVLGMYFCSLNSDRNHFYVTQLQSEPYFGEKESSLVLRVMQEQSDYRFDRAAQCFHKIAQTESVVKAPKKQEKKQERPRRVSGSMWEREQR